MHEMDGYFNELIDKRVKVCYNKTDESQIRINE